MRALLLDKHKSFKSSKFRLDKGSSYSLGNLTFQEVAEPTLGPSDVLIKSIFCGICGSDIDASFFNIRGESAFGGILKTPIILGHEVAGQVIMIGNDVHNVKINDIVTVESILSCGYCESCLEGNHNQCLNINLLGFTCNGSFADYFVIPEHCCHSLNPLLEHGFSLRSSLISGALIEPLACVYNGLFMELGGILPGSTVVVYGLGPIGVYAGMFAKIAGATYVLGFDKNINRRKWASELGFDHCFGYCSTKNSDSILEEIKRIIGSTNIDIQIEATGNTAECMKTISHLFSPKGKVLIFSRTRKSSFLDTNSVVTNAIKIVGSRGNSRKGIYRHIITMIANKQIEIDKLYGDIFTFNLIIDILSKGRSNLSKKILIEMG